MLPRIQCVDLQWSHTAADTVDINGRADRIAHYRKRGARPLHPRSRSLHRALSRDRRP